VTAELGQPSPGLAPPGVRCRLQPHHVRSRCSRPGLVAVADADSAHPPASFQVSRQTSRWPSSLHRGPPPGWTVLPMRPVMRPRRACSTTGRFPGKLALDSPATHSAAVLSFSMPLIRGLARPISRPPLRTLGDMSVERARTTRLEPRLPHAWLAEEKKATANGGSRISAQGLRQRQPPLPFGRLTSIPGRRAKSSVRRLPTATAGQTAHPRSERRCISFLPPFRIPQS